MRAWQGGAPCRRNWDHEHHAGFSRPANAGRSACAARPQDIRAQFLIEAATLSALGGTVGVVIGIGLAHAIAAMADWPSIISLAAILLSVGSSTLVGILFGFYPAHRASRLNPIEALRQE